MQQSSATASDLAWPIAAQLRLDPAGVHAAIALFGAGATVPFVARYRKEATAGLDESQLRAVQQAHAAAVALADRKAAITESVRKLGFLTQDLAQAIAAASDMTALEDLYLPFRPKRRTRAQAARELGLEPLALLMLGQGGAPTPLHAAAQYLDAERGLVDAETALAGGRDIAAELVSERADVRADLRDAAWRHGRLIAKRKRGVTAQDADEFRDYFDYAEPVARVPSHRYLAICRGEREGLLAVDVVGETALWQAELLRRVNYQPRSPWAEQLRLAVLDGWERLLWPAIATAVRTALKERADQRAIEVFADNLRDLLLAAPLGPVAILGVDPGLRTGCKLVAVDGTGGYLDHTVLYLVQGQGAQAQAVQDLLRLVRRHQPVAIAVGNGTGGREAEQFIRHALQQAGLAHIHVVMVSEAGASVYSASELARKQHPDLDITVRGALSIARRLQDPLAELVQIEAKAIGVGQYQHDVDQPSLERKLGDVVQSCVNQVGVELNSASPALLQHVAGIGPQLADKIVAHRGATGPFADRQALLRVKGLGPKAFEQAAGFLRIAGARNPLDASAVHPERYDLVGTMARSLGVDVAQLIGNRGLLDRVDIKKFLQGDVGEPTIRDILAELDKPGRDPRRSFEASSFSPDIENLSDLRPGMRLPGVVTNVAAFGAFVDVGVHHDGLVHVSQLAERFVRDPREVVHVGQRVQVVVLEVDVPRKRLALTMKGKDLQNG